MHYIRLLRPAKIQATPSGPQLSLLFTITTDLGDSFLCPDEGSLDLLIAVVDLARAPTYVSTRRCTCVQKWKSGMRVLDVKVQVPPRTKGEVLNCRVMIHPKQQSRTQLGALGVGEVLPWRGGEEGVIMPASFDIVDGVCAPVSVRTLDLGTDGDKDDGILRLGFEEDIGESIARHIWDAGVLTSAYLADAASSAETSRVIFPFEDDEDFNVLELGSGVGILGLTIAGILPRAARAQGRTLKSAKVLLTDLEEAEERARSNIARAEARKGEESDTPEVSIDYENLDWDEGREGKFGSLAAATRWDLIVLSDCTYNVDSLPALVGTLSALHDAKQHHNSIDRQVKSSVLLATKPRHSSEEALFGLLEEQSWAYRVVREIPLPKLGDEDEVVQIYLLEKGDAVA